MDSSSYNSDCAAITIWYVTTVHDNAKAWWLSRLIYYLESYKKIKRTESRRI